MSMESQTDRRELLKSALSALDEMQNKLDRLQAQLKAVEQAKREPIAIIGMSCRFPGGANSPEAYWELLRKGVDAVSLVPEDRWSVDKLPEATTSAIKNTAWYGGFLDKIDQFDPGLFGISPREAESMDPQQRLVLEVSWEALERACVIPDSLKGSLTGVFIGITTNDYGQLARQLDPSLMDAYTATGSALNAAAGRLAYTLGLQGPCMAVDTACSSSLVAIHLACQSLRSRECHLALAGGVNALLLPEPFICFSGWGMMASDGRCKTFDARADGFVRGEGCGMVVLKRLSDAQKDGDLILAIIRGSAVNQDGKSSGLTVPNGLAQQAVIRAALENAGLQPDEINYLEAHGTGTTLGDPIEVEAFSAVLGINRSSDNPLVVGSVKTNLGHLESASGVAGLIKVVLAMQHKVIPPHLHFKERSPRIPWPSFPIVIPVEPMAWPVSTKPIRAGVSSFGFSGTNAHVILEEAPGESSAFDGQSLPTYLLKLSAKSEIALYQLANSYQRFLDENPELSLPDLCFSANNGRTDHAERLGIIASSTEELKHRLSDFLSGKENLGVIKQLPSASKIAKTSGEHAKIAFIFTGQGAQYPEMGYQLYQTEPTFRRALEQCDEILRQYLDRPLLSLLYPAAGEVCALNQTIYTQPALFSVEYALAKLWQSWGIEPNAVMGHSVGEYVAACLAGVFGLEDGLKLIAARGRCMQSLPPGGKMVAVFASEEQVSKVIQPFLDQVSIAAVNGPDSTVISGNGEIIQCILEQLSEEGVQYKPLDVSHAFHSPLIEPVLDSFTEVAQGVEYASPRVDLVSNMTGRIAGEDISTPNYWRKHARLPVRFEDSIRFLVKQGYRIFLEIGPKPTLIGMAKRFIDEEILWLPSLRPASSSGVNEFNDWQQMLESLARLYVNGFNIHWDRVGKSTAGTRSPRKVILPTYPFQRQRYWLPNVDAGFAQRGRQRMKRDDLSFPLIGPRLSLASSPGTTIWEGELDIQRFSYFLDHRVQGQAVLPATAYVEMAMEAVADLYGPGPMAFRDVQNVKLLVLSGNAIPKIQLIFTPLEQQLLAFEIYSQQLDQKGDISQQWTLHASGKIGLEQDLKTKPKSPPFDPTVIQARCKEQISGADFYQTWREIGNQWGTTFQGIEMLWRGEKEAISRVRVPISIENDISSYLFHPAVADACGHVLVSLIQAMGTTSGQVSAFVGGGIREIRFYQKPSSSTLWCYANIQQAPGEKENVFVGDVQVWDESGALISETLGARLWFLDATSLLTDLDNWLYEIEWVPQTFPQKEILAHLQTSADVDSSPAWLILGDHFGVGKQLGKKLHAMGEDWAYLASDDLRNESDKGALGNPLDQPIRQVLHGRICKGIVFCSGLDCTFSEEMTASDLEDRVVQACGYLLGLVKGSSNFPEEKKPRLWVITKGAQDVKIDNGQQSWPIEFAQSAIWGFCRSLATEYPEMWGGIIDLDPLSTPEQDATLLFDELLNGNDEDQVAFRSGDRYVARLSRIERGRLSEPSLQFSSSGSYLITGGLGGIGIEVARWLVANGARHLILMSRTKLPAREMWDQAEVNARLSQRMQAIRQLEDSGAVVQLASVDVGDEIELRNWMESYVREGNPEIRGVIHAAGIMQYQPLSEHTVADMRDIVNPKVRGTWNLHSVFRDTSLDFFVLFSSASSLLNSPFVASYAAANAFLDAFAHYRQARDLPALSIDWGFWSKVGMVADFSQGNPIGERHGMGIIHPQQGLAALGRLISQKNLAQVGVFPMDWVTWQQAYPDFAKLPFLSKLVRPTIRQREEKVMPGIDLNELFQLNEAQRSERIYRYICEQVNQVLRIPLADIRGQESLVNMGLDSLMALELKNRIERDLGITVSMVNILQGPSVSQLSDFVMQKLILVPSSASVTTARTEVLEGSGHISQAEADRLLSSLDNLTDTQVDDLLNQLLSEQGDDL